LPKIPGAPGAQPGILLALHTWAEASTCTRNIHALVTDGGLPDGVWVKPRRSHFLPAQVVMQLFRGQLLDALRSLHRCEQLRLPDDLSPERFVSLLNRLGRKIRWNVRVCERYAHGREVSVYLARYVKGGPVNDTQIVHASEAQVCFRYTPRSEEGQPKARLRATWRRARCACGGEARPSVRPWVASLRQLGVRSIHGKACCLTQP
jgi:hypothetical protein